MVAGGHHIGAGIERFEKDFLGDAETAGRVLTIDDDKIQLEIADQAGKAVPDRGAAGSSDQISKK